jgi:hypothetical protein
MPDNRTIYSTDDGSNGVLTMFKADKPGDLTSGVSASPLADTQGGWRKASCIQLQRATAALLGVRDTLWHSLHSAQLLQRNCNCSCNCSCNCQLAEGRMRQQVAP